MLDDWMAMEEAKTATERQNNHHTHTQNNNNKPNARP